MPLKKTDEGVVLVKSKKPKFGKRPAQDLRNCWDMARIQSALLAKPKPPIWKRKEI